LVTRNTPTLKELFALETEGRKMGLRINEEKTKYMKISSIQARRYLQNLIIGDFNFEGVDNFTYLGSIIDNGNKMWKDIHSKIDSKLHVQHILNFSGLNFCPETLN
jgi:hypothetical protein